MKLLLLSRNTNGNKPNIDNMDYMHKLVLVHFQNTKETTFQSLHANFKPLMHSHQKFP